MKIRENVPLKDYSTMRLGGQATALTEITSKDELLQALQWAEEKDLPTLVLGGGSNIIFQDGYEGLVIVNRLQGFDVLQEDSTSAIIKIGAGEDWDTTVAKTVEKGLSGIEALSAIPGTAGATPVQNVGAYGQEIADTFVELTAYDTHAHKFVTLGKKDCHFSYRNSIFKAVQSRRYIIVDITLKLTKSHMKPPFYASLERYLDKRGNTTYSPGVIRQAVTAIRADRLPDPKLIANTGSFFKNPIVPASLFAKLAADHADMPHWSTTDGGVKLSAGWLIEQTGLQGYHSHGMKLYENNSLVFVNESAKNYDDLAAFRREIISQVQAKFGVTLEQEPELL